MFKRLLLRLMLCLLSALSLHAQEYQLLGKLIMEGGGTYTYKLAFTDSAGIIKGYSWSGHSLPYETQCEIVGTLDTQKGLLEFTETKTIYLSMNYDWSCRVRGSGRFRSERGLAWIVGFTWSIQPGCPFRGAIIMNPDDALNYRLTGFNPSAPKLLKKIPAAPSLIADTLLDEATQQLTSANPVQLNWQGRRLNLMLMDDKEEDGDLLSLILNGEALVREQELTKKEYIIEADLEPGLNKLVLHAENEGSLPPNTARIILWDDTQRYVVHSVINAGRDAVIEITVAD